MAAQFLGAYGHGVTKTPNLDRLAKSGVVFENAYSSSPLCAPARATIMNGLLPSRTGVYDNAAEFPSSIPTWAHYLRLQGYKTCLSGKMHFVGPDQLHGLEERLTTDIYPADFGWTPDWRLKQERIDWWYHNMTSVLQPGIAEITNQLEYDDEVAFLAVRKIYDYARFEPGKPFCLMASFTHPHDPYAARAKYWNLYRDEDIDLPRVGRHFRHNALDAHSKRLYDVSAMQDYTVTEADIRAARHGYYANISYVDDLVGKLLDALEATGQLDNTVIVFTSDHGDFLGERGLWYKMSYLEPSAHIPLIVCAPKKFKPRRVKEPVSLARYSANPCGYCDRRQRPNWPAPPMAARSIPCSAALQKIRKPPPGANIWPKAPWRPCTCSGAGPGNISIAQPIRISCSISLTIPTN